MKPNPLQIDLEDWLNGSADDPDSNEPHRHPYDLVFTVQEGKDDAEFDIEIGFAGDNPYSPGTEYAAAWMQGYAAGMDGIMRRQRRPCDTVH